MKTKKSEFELNELQILLIEMEGHLILRDNRIAKRAVVKVMGQPTYWSYIDENESKK